MAGGILIPPYANIETIRALAAKTTPADADVIPLLDSAASYAPKPITVANLLAAAGGGGGLTDPTTVGSCVMWFDASDATTLYTDAAKTTNVSALGDLVYVWADKSGSGNDLTQATSNNRPLYMPAFANGLSAVTTLLDTSSITAAGARWMTLSGLTDITVVDDLSAFVVYAPMYSSGSNGAIFSFGRSADVTDYASAGGAAIWIDNTPDIRVYANSVDRCGAYIADFRTRARTVDLLTDGSTWRIWAEGNLGWRTRDTSVSFGAPDEFTLFSSKYTSGYTTYDAYVMVCEVIIYNGALSLANQLSVRRYLQNKWNCF